MINTDAKTVTLLRIEIEGARALYDIMVGTLYKRALLEEILNADKILSDRLYSMDPNSQEFRNYETFRRYNFFHKYFHKCQ